MDGDIAHRECRRCRCDWGGFAWQRTFTSTAVTAMTAVRSHNSSLSQCPMAKRLRASARRKEAPRPVPQARGRFSGRFHAVWRRYQGRNGSNVTDRWMIPVTTMVLTAVWRSVRCRGGLPWVRASYQSQAPDQAARRSGEGVGDDAEALVRCLRRAPPDSRKRQRRCTR